MKVKPTPQLSPECDVYGVSSWVKLRNDFYHYSKTMSKMNDSDSQREGK